MTEEMKEFLQAMIWKQTVEGVICHAITFRDHRKGIHNDPKVLAAEVCKHVNECHNRVRGNRLMESKMSKEDQALIFERLLKLGLEIMES